MRERFDAMSLIGGAQPRIAGPGRVLPPAVLMLAVVAAAVLLLDALGLPLGPLRPAAGLLLALYVPGAALLAALGPGPLSAGSRGVLAIPTSLAIAALAGVALDHTALGVRPAAMAVTLLGLSAGLFALAALRRGRWAPVDPEAVDQVTLDDPGRTL